jgi:hypothetical protein
VLKAVVVVIVLLIGTGVAYITNSAPDKGTRDHGA